MIHAIHLCEFVCSLRQTTWHVVPVLRCPQPAAGRHTADPVRRDQRVVLCRVSSGTLAAVAGYWPLVGHRCSAGVARTIDILHPPCIFTPFPPTPEKKRRTQ